MSRLGILIALNSLLSSLLSSFADLELTLQSIMGTTGGAGARKDGTVPGTPLGGEEFASGKQESPTGAYEQEE